MVYLDKSDNEDGGRCLLVIRADDQGRMVETAVSHARVHDEIGCTFGFGKKPENTAEMQILSEHGSYRCSCDMDVCSRMVEYRVSST